jgi:hypothetical protein
MTFSALLKYSKPVGVPILLTSKKLKKYTAVCAKTPCNIDLRE